MRRHRLNIRLNPGATPGIRTRYCENLFHLLIAPTNQPLSFPFFQVTEFCRKVGLKTQQGFPYAPYSSSDHCDIALR